MRTWLFNILISLDQLLNVLIGPIANRLSGHSVFGYPDETISSALGKIKAQHGGQMPDSHRVAKPLASVLNKIDKGHVEKSVEKDEGKPGEKLDECR